MIVALCMWDILVGLAQIQQRELGNTRVLSYHWEIHFPTAVTYFPLSQADTGGLLFEKGIEVSCVCLKYYFSSKYP